MPKRIVRAAGDEVVADHPRHFRRDHWSSTIPGIIWPVLMKKPAPCATVLSVQRLGTAAALTQVRAKLKQHADGDRQFGQGVGAVSITAWPRSRPPVRKRWRPASLVAM